MASETPFTDMLRDLSSTMRLGTDHAAAAMGAAAAKIDARDRDVAELVAALEEARNMVSAWGAYADDYFKDKHGFVDDLAELDALIAKHKGGANAR